MSSSSAGGSATEVPGSRSSSRSARHGLSRRAVIGSAAAVTGASLGSGWGKPAAASADVPTAERPGSVPGAPHLPAGFWDTFTSRYIQTGDLRQHVVTGGEGPPLLLLHGWPQFWYAWRLVMPALARDFQVVAVDQRGMGRSGRPTGGYDTGTLAGDLVAVMDALGHQRFAMVGHDTGMWIGYALAADHPDRLDRLAVAEAPLPGVAPSPPLWGLPPLVTSRLYHLMFNQLVMLNEQLVHAREDLFFGFEFDIFAAKKLPDYAVRYYIDTLRRPDALHSSFELYRAFLDNGGAEQAARRPAADPARPGDRRSPEPWGPGRGRDEDGPRTTCRAWSFPAAATGLPRKLPRKR